MVFVICMLQYKISNPTAASWSLVDAVDNLGACHKAFNPVFKPDGVLSMTLFIAGMEETRKLLVMESHNHSNSKATRIGMQVSCSDTLGFRHQKVQKVMRRAASTTIYRLSTVHYFKLLTTACRLLYIEF